MSTPLGHLLLAYRGRTVCYAALASGSRAFERACAKACGARPIRDRRLPKGLARQVRDHLTGKRRFSGRVDLSRRTPFQREVLEKTRQIPAGEVRSYRWVAKAIGAERAARAVGTALAKNPIPLLIPCHRVVRSDGRLGEYSGGGPSMKARLLALEGVELGGPSRLANRREIAIGPGRKRGAGQMSL